MHFVGDRAEAQAAQRGCEVCSLEISKSCVDVVLGTLLCMALIEQGLGQMDSGVPANLSYSGIL